MRVTAAVLFAIAATAVSAGAQVVSSPSDRAFQLVGTWSCESLAHSVASWVFSKNSDGSISLRNSFVTASGNSGEFDEQYRRDPTTGQWSWSSLVPSNPGFKETGTSGAWNGEKWIFEGSLTNDLPPPKGFSQGTHVSGPLRMVFTTLGDDAFRRDFEMYRSGGWVTTSASTCKRVAAVEQSDAVAELRKKMKSAQDKVSSLRMEMSSPAGMTGVITFINHPARMHMQMASGPISVEAYALDGYLYQRVGTGPWRRQQLPNEKAGHNFASALTNAVHMSLGPDTVEDGTTYGSYDIQSMTVQVPGAPKAPPMRVTCTYDKSTFLVHSCKNPLFTYTFTGYNDPNNTITAPPDLANAVDAGPVQLMGAPAPQASPKL